MTLLSYIYPLWFVSSSIFFVFPHSVTETELRQAGQFGATRHRDATFLNDPIEIKHPSLQTISSNEGSSSLPFAKGQTLWAESSHAG